jgi:hypothetical protein
MDSRQEFIAQLLKDIGTPDGMDKEVYARLVADLSERLTKFINRRIIEALPESDLPGLEKLMKEPHPNQELLQQYINQHLPNPVDVTAKAMDEFRRLYLGKQD